MGQESGRRCEMAINHFRSLCRCGTPGGRPLTKKARAGRSPPPTTTTTTAAAGRQHSLDSYRWELANPDTFSSDVSGVWAPRINPAGLPLNRNPRLEAGAVSHQALILPGRAHATRRPSVCRFVLPRHSDPQPPPPPLPPPRSPPPLPICRRAILKHSGMT